MNIIEDKKGRVVAIGTFLTVVGGTASAALPAGIENAIQTAGTDLVTAATAVVVSLISFWAIRAVGKKMGWWAS